jgi:hypothetical protein
MLTNLSTTVLAANQSKTITHEIIYTFLITPSDFPKYYNSPSSYVSPTYKYNDGKYKGTLNLKSSFCCVPDGMYGYYLRVKVYTFYSGTVSTIVVPTLPKSKKVTYSNTYSFLISPSQLSFYRNFPSSYVPSVFYYNDGTYSGYINLVYANPSVPYSTVGLLNITIYTQYAGTVFLKQ